jgi:DNA-binding response OmpR family regulator
MKGKVFLIHWNRQESDILIHMVQAYGWEVTAESEDGSRAGRLIKEREPDVVVIFLSRQPSHGRETGIALRSVKATMDIPIIFVDGTDEINERIKQKVPDAIFSTSEKLKDTLVRFAHY